MRQVCALFKKEILSLFRSYLFYFLLLIYLCGSVWGAFYIGSMFAAHDTAMYSLFYVQPMILIIIVPAITMKMWAEEYRQATAEFLLTQPISFLKLTVVKFLSAFFCCWLMSLFLIAFVIYVSGWLYLDLGNIISAFCGLWLLMGFLCALGCFISALVKNMIIAYILSVSSMVLLFLISHGFINTYYNNFIFAQVGFSDIAAFLLFILIFILLNKTMLDFGKSAAAHKKIHLAVFCALAIFGGLIFSVGMNNFTTAKFDATSAQSYTPKKQSQQLIKSIQNPLNIEVYIAKDYLNSSTENYHHFQQISRFLQKYQTLSAGMINVNINVVEPFSQMEEQALDNGLYFELNTKGTRDYFGAIITSSDGNFSVIKQFLRFRQIFAEQDIDKAIYKVIFPQKVKVLAVYMDPQQNLNGFQGVLLALENDYKVELVSSTTFQISNKVDLLIMINPKKLEPVLQYAVDQYIMRGGKAIFVYDFYTANQNQLVNMDQIDILRFLQKWEILLYDNMTDDGIYNNKFGKVIHNIKLDKAVAVKSNDQYNFTDFIKDDEKFVGAVIEGEFSSIYADNPYQNTQIGKKMLPFRDKTPQKSQIALIGDADFLLDDNWVFAGSADLNPFSVIETTSNAAAFMRLVDYMVANDEYAILPINEGLLNEKSIGERLSSAIYSRKEADFMALKNKIANDKLRLYSNLDTSYDDLNELALISQSGRTLKGNEKRLEQMKYEMNKEYEHKIYGIMLFWGLFLPLLATVFCGLAFLLINTLNRPKLPEIKS